VKIMGGCSSDGYLRCVKIQCECGGKFDHNPKRHDVRCPKCMKWRHYEDLLAEYVEERVRIMAQVT
jgi:hypothetical protein